MPSNDTPLQRAVMRNTARRGRPGAEAWAVEALGRPAAGLSWLDVDEAYDLRTAFSHQLGSVLGDEGALDVAVTTTTRDETVFDESIARARPVLQAAAQLVWLLKVPGHGVLVDADDVLSRTRSMIGEALIPLEVLSRDGAVGFYADIDLSSGRVQPDYIVQCWRAADMT